MASSQSSTPSGSAGASSASADTVIPKSYAKGIAMTPDPLQICARLEYGADRSCAWSVQQEVMQTPPSAWPKLEARLLATLALPECTDAARTFLCQMLAMVGSAKSVPALAPLLRNPKSTEAARYALEAIAGPEATTALREALGSLQGNAKAGLIGSIAARRDAAARPALTSLKDNASEPAVVRDAARRALESLATA